jgi:hypothetical protein
MVGALEANDRPRVRMWPSSKGKLLPGSNFLQATMQLSILGYMEGNSSKYICYSLGDTESLLAMVRQCLLV